MRTTQFNFRIRHDLLKRIKRESKRLKISNTQFVRRQISRYFDEQDLKNMLKDKK
jgi:hypothetical protein